jgi:hypothetical protein
MFKLINSNLRLFRFQKIKTILTNGLSSDRWTLCAERIPTRPEQQIAPPHVLGEIMYLGEVMLTEISTPMDMDYVCRGLAPPLPMRKFQYVTNVKLKSLRTVFVLFSSRYCIVFLELTAEQCYRERGDSTMHVISRAWCSWKHMPALLSLILPIVTIDSISL